MVTPCGSWRLLGGDIKLHPCSSICFVEGVGSFGHHWSQWFWTIFVQVPWYPPTMFYELHWLTTGVWMQFKAPVITSKAIYGIGPGYLKSHLSFIISAILYDQAESAHFKCHPLNSVIWRDLGSMPFYNLCLPSGTVP